MTGVMAEDETNWLMILREQYYRMLRERGWWSGMGENRQTYWKNDKLPTIKLTTTEAIHFERNQDDLKRTSGNRIPHYSCTPGESSDGSA